MNTIVINNQKGGVGKTTLAVHLAWFMAEAGRRVLMIDVDAQGNATDTLKQHTGSTSAADLFKPATRFVAGENNGITLAPADSSLTDIDRGNAAAVMTLQQNLANASEQFDICVIDTPPSLGLRSVACLVAASHVLAPIYLEDYSVKGVKGLMQTVIGVQRRYGRQDTRFLGLLPSNFNTKSPRQRTHLEQLLREAGRRRMTLDLSFKELVDVAANRNAATGRPLLIAIDSIDEDPDQPRRNFSEQELEELSQSIREHGVLQPIIVRGSGEDGRHVIVMGARRYRAAQRAGLREIPALIQEGHKPDRYAQMIENIQRDDLRAPEIAAFISDRLNAGDTQADVSRKLGKSRDWVSRYASVQSMPEFLRTKLEGSSIRALYELYQAWRTHPNDIERLCAMQDSFTGAQARQLARGVRGEADRANAQSGSSAGSPQSNRCDLLPDAFPRRVSTKHRESVTDDPLPKPRCVSQSRSAASLAIRVRYQNRVGQLVVDRLATQGSRHAVVLVDGAGEAEEVPASALTIEEILPR